MKKIYSLIVLSGAMLPLCAAEEKSNQPQTFAQRFGTGKDKFFMSCNGLSILGKVNKQGLVTSATVTTATGKRTADEATLTVEELVSQVTSSAADTTATLVVDTAVAVPSKKQAVESDVVEAAGVEIGAEENDVVRRTDSPILNPQYFDRYAKGVLAAMYPSVDPKYFESNH